MISTYYTIRELASRWDAALGGAHITDAFSHHKGEAVLATQLTEQQSSLTISVAPANIYAFRGQASRPRRNVADIMVQAVGERIVRVRVADRDRVMHIELQSGRRIDMFLFGSRANVVLVEDEKIIDAFLRRSTVLMKTVPSPRPARMPPSESEFVVAAGVESGKMEAAVKKAFPLFDRTLVAEAVARAERGVDDGLVARVYRASVSIERELETPQARIYDLQSGPLFSLIELSSLEAAACERYDDVDVAVRRFIVGSLSRDALSRRRDPLLKRLQAEATKLRRSVERMSVELETASRADHYEKIGHLLMAGAPSVEPGVDAVEMDDIIGDGGKLQIRLNPALSPIENAQAYYDRARRVRGARETAVSRLKESSRRLRKLDDVVARLESAANAGEIDELEEANAEVFERSGRGQVRRPFRRIGIAADYEVWVGRSARENDELTFEHARKFDIWLHARGVPGSHVLLRLPSRETEPPPAVIERAASIAAWFSKARGSGLVPVIFTPRKFVRKPRGAGPGKVIVEREKVVTVEPREP